MRRQRRTKILATLGPASNSEEMITALVKAGVDIFRINMSHSSHDVLRTSVEKIRRVEKDLARPLGILMDLQGPKLRVGLFNGDKATLNVGDSFILDDNKELGNAKRVHLPHPEILESLEEGHNLLIDDGRLKLRVTKTNKKQVTCEVIIGGIISNKKGVSLPDTYIKVSAMTPKDRSDLDAGLTLPIDWVALSFVQRPEDIAEVKKIAKGKVGVMAKIEKPQALTCINEIIEISDAIMVARGDLGVELPISQVPTIQKQLTRACKKLGKPVVVATQMLESMITSPLPTRAEVSDVASAIYEGVDAVMLSAESAAGQYPIEAVSMMNQIAEEVESDPTYAAIMQSHRTSGEATGADAISAATRQIGEQLDVSAICCWTFSGSTALRVARERPRPLTIAISPLMETARKLTLCWGIHSVCAEDASDLDDMVTRACHYAKQDGFAKVNDRVIVVAGVPLGTPGSTNMLRLAYVK